MSWLFSRVLVEEYSEGISSDGEPSAPLSENPMPQAYLCSDKMMGFSRLSRFGMTFRLLTESRGEALLTLYLEGFPARTLVQQEKVRESTESDRACGEKWQGSFAKYDPDTHSLRTHQCSLLEDLTESCQTLPAWGLMRDGECWEQPTLGLRIRGTESGLWPTPRAREPARTSEGYGRGLKELIEGKQQIKRWPKPTAHNAKETNAPSEHNRNTPTLTAQVNWPTPRTKGMCGGSGSWELLKKNTTIEEARLMGAGNGGQLNPTWVEWLMGWPLEWTDLKPLETDKFQQWQHQHGIY